MKISDLIEVAEALREGRVTPATEELASALEQIARGELKPKDLDAALGLRVGRGRPRGSTVFKLPFEAPTGVAIKGKKFTKEQYLACLNEECRFIYEHMRSDKKHRGARERALNAASKKFSRTRRTLERQWKEARPTIKWYETWEAIEKQMEPVFSAFGKKWAPDFSDFNPILAATRPLRTAAAKLAASQKTRTTTKK